MTITWTTTEQPEPPPPIVRTWRLVVQRWAKLSDTVLESHDATPADLRVALQSLPPAERAEVVGEPSEQHAAAIRALKAAHSDSIDAVQKETAAAIARAEAAERERDEATAREKLATKLAADSVADALTREGNVRSDLARVTKERDEARRMAEEYRDAWRSLRGLVENSGEVTVSGEFAAEWDRCVKRLDAIDPEEEVDALTAQAAPKPAAELAAEHGFTPHGLPLDVALRGHGRAKPPPDPSATSIERGKGISVPDPNEREELGRLLRDISAGPSGGSWEQLGESRREDYRRAASAVAAHVRRDGGKGR